jgi:hypothetical protein
MHIEFSFFICLRAAGLTFAVAGAIIEPKLARIWCGGVDVAGQVTGSMPASARDPPVQVETAYTSEVGVLEVDLVSGRTETVDRDTVYNLLKGCL